MTTFQVAEKFKSVQGEGMFTGTPMAFIRFVGCSVGKQICHFCDTDFNEKYPWLGGGEFTGEYLLDWATPYRHICLTGGEPLNQLYLDIFFDKFQLVGKMCHIETSGTIYREIPEHVHVCVSPKPGWQQNMIERADEIKVIVPGLGNGEGWPDLGLARQWAAEGKNVYIQPRNAKHDITPINLALCQKLVEDYPELKLSVQMHKILRVR